MIKLVSFVEKMLFDFEKIVIYDLKDNLLYRGTKTDFLEKNILQNYIISTFWVANDKLFIYARRGR